MNEARTPGALWPLPRVMAAVGFGRSKIYDMIGKGEFPAPLRLSRRASRWSQASVEAWIAQRIEKGGM